MTNSPKQLVLTIHGVNPDGIWQEMIRRVFEPHYRYSSIRYPNFHGKLGIIRATHHPYLLMGLAITLVAVFWLRWHASPWAWIFAGSLFLAGFVLAWYNRGLAVDRIKRDLDDVRLIVDRPHLIAHSFGSFLSGRAIDKFHDLQFMRIIFVGCVLPRSFQWKRIAMRGSTQFHDIRNEVGRKDLVAWAAGILGLGSAGMLGFKGSTDFVHEIPGPLSPCPHSKDYVCDGRVHNVALDHFAHGDQYLSPMHAQLVWLPVLWGFSPIEFLELLRLCYEFAIWEDFFATEGFAKDHEELIEAESKLRDFELNWTGQPSQRTSLVRYVTDFTLKLLQSRTRRLARVSKVSTIQVSYVADEVASRAVRSVSHAVKAAVEEAAKAERNDHLILAMHPRIAIMRAVESVLETL